MYTVQRDVVFNKITLLPQGYAYLGIERSYPSGLLDHQNNV